MNRSKRVLVTSLCLLLLGIAKTSRAWSLRRHYSVAAPLRSLRLIELFTSQNDEAIENDGDNMDTKTTTTDSKVENSTVNKPETTSQPSAAVIRRPPPPPASSLSARDMMTALGTSPRRIFLSGLSATGIALAGNLFGITSQLLMAFPEDQVAATGLDTYFPRGDYKRYRTADYSLVIPREWVADTAVELAKAQRRSMSLDYSMRKSPSSVLPDAAFGPPGNLLKENTAGDTNVSIIRTLAPANFDLRQVMTSSSSSNTDDPTMGAQFLLQNFLAGNGRKVTLLSVDSDTNDKTIGKTTSYRLSYRVDRGETRAPLQAVSIIAQKYGSVTTTAGSTLFTITVVAPVEAWQSEFSTKLNKIADTFVLTPN